MRARVSVLQPNLSVSRAPAADTHTHVPRPQPLPYTVFLLVAPAPGPPLLPDKVRAPLPDHDGRQHGVRARHAREDARVGEAQVAHPVDAQALVDGPGARVPRDGAGARRVQARRGHGADVLVDLAVRDRRPGAAVDLVAAAACSRGVAGEEGRLFGGGGGGGGGGGPAGQALGDGDASARRSGLLPGGKGQGRRVGVAGGLEGLGQAHGEADGLAGDGEVAGVAQHGVGDGGHGEGVCAGELDAAPGEGLDEAGVEGEEGRVDGALEAVAGHDHDLDVRDVAHGGGVQVVLARVRVAGAHGHGGVVEGAAAHEDGVDVGAMAHEADAEEEPEEQVPQAVQGRRQQVEGLVEGHVELHGHGVVVGQGGADLGQVPDHGDAVLLELPPRAQAAEHQHLGGDEPAAADNHLPASP
ncbi:hypothetical protein OPQ81_000109 [Rhizoctonia solani]|nr:hypothetical protein OPQ81_000109 [Rhizoctonia solani]